MPYFNHSMVRSFHQSKYGTSSNTTSSARQTRSMPGRHSEVHRHTDPSLAGQYRLQMTQRKLLFMQSLLRAQINQMVTTATAFSVEEYRQTFKNYKIEQNILRYSCSNLKIYSAKSLTAPSMSLCVRVYPRASHNPDSSLYLKILRHLGRKHPYIIHTWEIFYDKDHVFIFQEWAIAGNLSDFLARNNVQEKRAAFWAKQFFRALDFLGDQAIAHRDLSPVHLVVQPQSRTEMWLKLTGFKQAIIYWDASNNDVVFCPCRSVEKQNEDGANFQPPEVYGNPDKEQFDPILADTWSYGANVYFMLAKQYPYNLAGSHENVDDEIRQNVKKLNTVTEECRNFLFALMRGNANDRMPFDFIEAHPWFKAHSVSATNKKPAEPVKSMKVNQPKSMKSKAKTSTPVASEVGKVTTATAPHSEMGKAQAGLNQLVRDINTSISSLSLRSDSYTDSDAKGAASDANAKERASVIESLRHKLVYLIKDLRSLFPSMPVAKRDELMEDVSLLEVCSDAITVEQFERYSSMMLQIMAKIDKLLYEIKPSWA